MQDLLYVFELHTQFSILSLAQKWILCSEWVPSEWESKQLIKTSQVIHITPVINYVSVKWKAAFVRNKLPMKVL